MERKRSGKRLMILSILGFFVCALSALLLPLSVAAGRQLSVIGLLVGILFWVGLLGGIVLFFMSWLKVKSDRGYLTLKTESRWGLISFFRSGPAATADVLCIVMIIATVVGNLLPVFPYVLNAVIIFILIFTFCLHCILNGRVFRYLCKGRRFL